MPRTRSLIEVLALPTALALALLAASSVPAGATSYVMVSDPVLVEQAEVIAEVEVLDAGPAPTAGMPATDYIVAVHRVLKGEPGGGQLVVRVPGGDRPDGLGVVIWGAPRFHPGDRGLLFLAERADGAWEPLHLMLGAFHERRVEGRRLAVRDLGEASEIASSDGGEEEIRPGRDRLRDLDRFAEWITARAAGEEPAADYFVEDPRGDLQRVVDAFTLLTFPDGMNPRWQVFDTGGNVPWRTQTGGFPGLAGGGIAQIENAFNAWNSDPQTPVDYRHVGFTDSTNGFQMFDGINSTIFGDPNNFVPGTFACGAGQGGILAFGGAWTQGTHNFNQKNWKSIAGTEVIFNDGVECRLNGNPTLFENVCGHEDGHTLGLGHSCGDVNSPPCAGNPVLNDALMRATVHDDGRGAQLNSDDLAGLRTIYSMGGGDDVPPSGPCVADENTLCFFGNRFRARLTGMAPDGRAITGKVAAPKTDASGLFWFSPTGNADNWEVLIKMINGCGSPLDAYWVFLAATTNVGYTITVTDTQANKQKPYSNPVGKAAQPVQDTAAFANCP